MKDAKFTKRALLIFLIIAILAHGGLAKDITFTLNQSDYYFLVGQEAVIPLAVDNTYDNVIDGTLSYSMTQEVNQAGFHYSSSNSQSTPMTAKKGKSIVGISFGSSQSPLTLKIGLSFNYNDGKDQRVVDLNNITIYFISNTTQKQNSQSQVQSSSQKSTGGQQQGQQGNMQQMINQMLGNQQQAAGNQQSPQDRVENNQIAQDSSALKKQIQEEQQEQEQMNKEFEKNLAANSDFQKENQGLQSRGYNITGSKLMPTSNDTGNFSIQYNNSRGETAQLSGEMRNGSMKNLQSFTDQDRENLLDKLEQDKDFKRYSGQLESEGFGQESPVFSHQQNKTEITMNYRNSDNETASIKAEFTGDNITNVTLQKDDIQRSHRWMWLWLLLIPFAAVAAYLVYVKHHKRQPGAEKEALPDENPFDHAAEANMMLKNAQLLFKKKQYKDAYGTAGQALRLFLSYENNLKKELTNDDIISHLKKSSSDYKDAKACFDLCSLVEFAKYKANKTDFDRIIGYAGSIIRQKHTAAGRSQD